MNRASLAILGIGLAIGFSIVAPVGADQHPASSEDCP